VDVLPSANATEPFWNLRELFESGEVDIDELDAVLAAQLGSINWIRGLPRPDQDRAEGRRA
jgi:hypothetical protein